MAQLNWNGRNYRPVGNYIKVVKPDINELMKPLSLKSGLGSVMLTGNAVNPRNNPSVTPSVTPTITVTPSITPTTTLTPTPSITPTLTQTPSITPTNTLTPTTSVTPTITPTNTVTPTVTSTPLPADCVWNRNDELWNSNTNLWNDCQNVPPTPSVTPTSTLTPTPSITPTITPTITLTPSITPSSTPVAFSPNQISNLQFWFDASSGFTPSIWTNYGLLGGSIDQGTAVNQPSSTTTTLGSFTGTGIQFSSRDVMLKTTFSSTDFTNHTYFWVGKRVAADTFAYIGFQTYSSSSANVLFYTNGGGTIAQRNYLVNAGGRQYTSGATNNTPLLLEVTGTTTDASVYLNGVLMSSAATISAINNITSLQMGRDAGGTTTNNTVVVEFLAYNKNLTTSEAQQVEDYLKTKYQYSSW